MDSGRWDCRFLTASSPVKPPAASSPHPAAMVDTCPHNMENKCQSAEPQSGEALCVRLLIDRHPRCQAPGSLAGHKASIVHVTCMQRLAACRPQQQSGRQRPQEAQEAVAGVPTCTRPRAMGALSTGPPARCITCSNLSTGPRAKRGKESYKQMPAVHQ